MNLIRHKKNIVLGIAGWAAVTFMLAGLSGCLSSYGSLKKKPEVLRAFKSGTVPADYKYYYYGYSSLPYAIVGVAPAYNVESKLWKAVDPQSKKFQQMVPWIWEDYGYRLFGADILDPQGKTVGIWYASMQSGIKFGQDKSIMFLPELPFVWGGGPADGNIRDLP